jgi:hypothetical protein
MSVHGIVSKLLACLDQLGVGHFALLLVVQVFEKRLHLLQVRAEHVDGSDSAQELIKINVDFLTFVEEGKNSFHDFWGIVDAEHLG